MFYRSCVTCTKLNFERMMDVLRKIMQIYRKCVSFFLKPNFEAIYLKFVTTDPHVLLCQYDT